METQQFNEGAKYLLRRNLKGILGVVLEEIADFKQSNAIKIKSLNVLYNLIRGCGSEINQYVDRIVYALYPHCDDEELGPVASSTAEMIGLHTDQNVSIPIVAKHLSEIEIKNSYQPLSNRLNILSSILSKTANITEESVSMVLKVLHNLDIFNMPDNNYIKNILKYTFKIYDGLICNLQKNCVRFHSELFFPLLFLHSLPDTQSLRESVEYTIHNLAVYCGFSNVEDLYSMELAFILEKFQETHKQWKRNSPDRFAFDTYVRGGGSALEKHWTEILLIISQCCEPTKDIEMRIDMMVLMDYLIDEQIIAQQLKNYIEFILPEILLPATAWKSQRPYYKIRKSAMVCIIKLFRNNIIDTETSMTFLKDIFQVLKSTLEDDYDPELRYLSIQLTKYLLMFTKDRIGREEVLDFYPNLLKRLDDSQDANRISISEVFKLFFQINERVQVADSTYEYIVNTCFIHLDDSNENVRNAVFEFLREASKTNQSTFIKICNKNLMTFTHPDLCRKLIEYSNN
jgi:hypothetical protein